MEGVESFAGLMKSSIINEEYPPNWDYTPDGRKFLSSRATAAAEPSEVKHGR